MFNEEYVSKDNQHLTNYFRLLIGSALTGRKPEGKIPVILGDGNNGKSTLFSMILSAFPIIAKQFSKSVITYTGNKEPDANKPNPFLCQIEPSCRIAILSELSQEDNINQNIAKCITGQEQVFGRKLNANGGGHDLNCMLTIQSSNIPRCPSTYALMKRFSYLIVKSQFLDVPNPLISHQKKKDPRKAEQMKSKEIAEAAFIYFTRSAYEYNNIISEKGYIDIPDEVNKYTQESMKSGDNVASFFDSEILKLKPTNEEEINKEEEYALPEDRTQFIDIYTRYNNFCKGNGTNKDEILCKNKLGSRLKELYGESIRSNGKTFYRVKLRTNSQYITNTATNATMNSILSL